MAVDWTPLFVLPNVELRSAIKCDIAALVPAHDQRVVDLMRAQPMFCRFLDRFADNFGEYVEPAVLLVRGNAPQSFFEIEALAGFRDLIAISVVAYNRALELCRRRGLRVLFADAFALYPWMLDPNYENLIVRTPALRGVHEVATFQGQSAPALSRMSLDAGDIDQPLLTALLERWRRRYEAAEPEWEDIALFRSLNMAYHASMLPSGIEATFYDVGRLVSLWVSAFEILAHPGGDDRVNRCKVFELIEKTPWKLEEMAEPGHDTGGNDTKRTLASWVYQGLYDCRNDFLHGNPVEPDDLQLPGSERTAFQCAAPLYRLALTAFLPFTFDGTKPAESDSDAAWGAYADERMVFPDPQEIAEKAILTAKPAVPNE